MASNTRFTSICRSCWCSYFYFWLTNTSGFWCFQVVYVTATFPYFVLLVLIIKGATLEGSLQGVAFYLTPDWSRLASAQVLPGTPAGITCSR